jgi:putative transposase
MQLNYEKFEPPDWFNPEISLLLPLPLNNYVKDNTNINFGLKEYNDKFNQHFSFLAHDNIFEYRNTDFSKSNDDIEKEILQKKSKNLKFAKNASSIKSIETKFNNKINNLDKTTVSFTFKIFPTHNQINKIKVWINEALAIYNCCVDIHNSDFYYFNKGYMSAKLDIFDYLGGNFNCPYDSRTDAVKKFCDNLSSAKSNYKRGNIKKFLMKKKNIDNAQNIFIPKTAITKDSFYRTHLGKIKGMEEFFNENNIDENLIGDSYFRYDTLKNEYFFILSYHKLKKNIENRKKAVAIDPGEAVAFSYFSEDGFGNLGMNIREKILKEQQKIKKIQSILNKNLNREDKSIKNKCSLKKRINRHFANIKNYVKELHNKAALFFVKNYDIILIPEFKTQQMISNENKVKYVLNLEPNIKISQNELLKKLEGKSLEEINDILNLFIKKENNTYAKELNKEENKEENKERKYMIKYHEQIDKIKKSEKISTEEKKDLINITKELIKLENMGKKLKEDFNNLKKKDNKTMNKIIENKGEEEIEKLNKNFNCYLSKVEEEMFNNLKDLGLENKEIEKYMKKIKKEEDENIRKKRVDENVKNIRETLKKQKENKEEIEKEKKERKKEKNERLKNIFNLIKEKYGEEILKLYKKEVTRRSRLNKRVKFVMQMLSHYKFRQHLKNKCNEYGCEMIVITEEYTSKTCTNCGKIENNFRKREKQCSNCNYKVNRDIGGARNIMIKNSNEILKKYKKLEEIVKNII